MNFEKEIAPDEKIEGMEVDLKDEFDELPELDDPDITNELPDVDVDRDSIEQLLECVDIDDTEITSEKKAEQLSSEDATKAGIEQKEETDSDNSEISDDFSGNTAETGDSHKNDCQNETSEGASEKHDADDIQLRDLTEEEKQKLREAGMSEENINKCQIDQNGKVHIKTINSAYEGKTHPETGVKYVRKTINLNGIEVEGVFPEFDSVFDCYLPEKLLKASDGDQFAECMKQLKEAIEKDPELASKFSEKQLEQIMNGNPPRIPGYTWHHNEVTGKMELVKDVDHQKSSHTGGKSIWGGGNENR